MQYIDDLKLQRAKFAFLLFFRGLTINIRISFKDLQSPVPQNGISHSP